jgi:maltooligosyltrehalose trehalohydrolase
VLTDAAFVLRFFGQRGDDRLLVVNLGARYHADPLAEPLVAPLVGRSWTTVFSTDEPEYGGWGTPPIATTDDGWWLPAECAALLAPTA